MIEVFEAGGTCLVVVVARFVVVERFWSRVDRDADRSNVVEGIVEVTGGNVDVSRDASPDRGLMASAVGVLVGSVRFSGGDPSSVVAEHPVVRLRVEASIARRVALDPRTVHEVLLREFDELAFFGEGKLSLYGARGSVTPARTAGALVLNGRDDAGVAPIDGFWEWFSRPRCLVPAVCIVNKATTCAKSAPQFGLLLRSPVAHEILSQSVGEPTAIGRSHHPEIFDEQTESFIIIFFRFLSEALAKLLVNRDSVRFVFGMEDEVVFLFRWSTVVIVVRV